MIREMSQSRMSMVVAEVEGKVTMEVVFCELVILARCSDLVF